MRGDRFRPRFTTNANDLPEEDRVFSKLAIGDPEPEKAKPWQHEGYSVAQSPRQKR